MQADLCVSFLGWRLYDSRSLSLLGCGTAYIVDFNFPEDARWNGERQAVEFGVEIGERRGVVRVPRRVAQGGRACRHSWRYVTLKDWMSAFIKRHPASLHVSSYDVGTPDEGVSVRSHAWGERVRGHRPRANDRGADNSRPD